MQGDTFHTFAGVSFGGVACAQFWADFVLWEALLNMNPQLEGIVEIGTFYGGFSRYLYAQAEARKIWFVTFDSVQPADEPPCFDRLDVFRFPEKVEVYLAGKPVILFCDGGNKPREMKLFPPMCGEGSLIVVHDWGTEVLPKDVPDFLVEYEAAYTESIGSASRVFTVKP